MADKLVQPLPFLRLLNNGNDKVSDNPTRSLCVATTQLTKVQIHITLHISVGMI